MPEFGCVCCSRYPVKAVVAQFQGKAEALQKGCSKLFTGSGASYCGMISHLGAQLGVGLAGGKNFKARKMFLPSLVWSCFTEVFEALNGWRMESSRGICCRAQY